MCPGVCITSSFRFPSEKLSPSFKNISGSVLSCRESAAWAAFLAAWHEVYEDNEVSVAELVQRLNEQKRSVLSEALPTELVSAIERGNYAAQAIGRALSSRKGRRFLVGEQTLWLEKAGADRHAKAVLWKVQTTAPNADARQSEEGVV